MDPDLTKALLLLEHDEVVGMPTETVYGLAARIDRPVGLAKIFSTKQRPLFDPLIVHVSSIAMAKTYTSDWSGTAEALAKNFWPGPLTLVLPKSDLVPAIVTSGLETVGLRMPKNDVALELIRLAGVGLAAPSANRFGRTSPTRWEHVDAEFEGEVFSLKSTPSEIGIESTVLEIRGGELIIHRAGAVSKSQIEKVLQSLSISFIWISSETNPKEKKSPGQMQHHYMPSVPLVWVESNLPEDEIQSRYLEAAPSLPEKVEGVQILKAEKINSMKELKLSDDPALAARELYHEMREAARDADLIYFRKHPSMSGESWDPILERLTKAASLKLH